MYTSRTVAKGRRSDFVFQCAPCMPLGCLYAHSRKMWYLSSFHLLPHPEWLLDIRPLLLDIHLFIPWPGSALRHSIPTASKTALAFAPPPVLALIGYGLYLILFALPAILQPSSDLRSGPMIHHGGRSGFIGHFKRSIMLLQWPPGLWYH